MYNQSVVSWVVQFEGTKPSIFEQQLINLDRHYAFLTIITFPKVQQPFGLIKKSPSVAGSPKSVFCGSALVSGVFSQMRFLEKGSFVVCRS